MDFIIRNITGSAYSKRNRSIYFKQPEERGFRNRDFKLWVSIGDSTFNEYAIALRVKRVL